MKLDTNYLNFISKDEVRVLTAIEMGMKNHEYVPMELVERISRNKRANAFKIIKLLVKNKLVEH
jgi:RIO kinase 2